MMSLKHYCFILLFGFFVNVCSCLAQLKYSIVGTYKGKSAQGMAIWKDKAYLFNDGGHCRVLNIHSNSIISEFDLASSGTNNHVNAACFGVESIEKGGMPVIYVSEYRSPSRCFVEQIKDSTSVLLQTIVAENGGKNRFVQAWVVDKKEGYLYAIARRDPTKAKKRNINVRIVKYRLPRLIEGSKVFLTDNDILDDFDVQFHNGIQGAKIRGDYLYIVTGLQEASSGEINAKRAIQIIDLKKRNLIRSVDLTFVTTNEPEDIDFCGHNCFLYCGQNGGIHKIKL